MLSTYPPTECGLATFAAATRQALVTAKPTWDVAMIRACDASEAVGNIEKSADVVAMWRAGDAGSLDRAASAIDATDVLVLQHEYGIYGGEDGSDVLGLLRAVDVPVVAVLHTVLSRPSLGQRRVIAELGKRASCLVVMSDAARDQLLRHYPVRPGRVLVIPHGAHPVPFRLPVSTDRVPIALTWGLVGPGKGLERAIDAVALLRERRLDVDYRIVGKTHPKVSEREGERYRSALVDRAAARGVADLVTFDDSYRPVASLISVIADADLVVIPYDSREQVTSGVLVEALAAGKVVVATAFPHASEALRGGAGVVVAHDHPSAMAAAMESLLSDTDRLQRMSRIALREGARMLWPAVGESLATVIESVLSASSAVLDITAVCDRVEAS